MKNKITERVHKFLPIAASSCMHEAKTVQYGDSFILMMLLTSAKQRSGSDLSYHSGEREGELLAL